MAGYETILPASVATAAHPPVHNRHTKRSFLTHTAASILTTQLGARPVAHSIHRTHTSTLSPLRLQSHTRLHLKCAHTCTRQLCALSTTAGSRLTCLSCPLHDTTRTAMPRSTTNTRHAQHHFSTIHHLSHIPNSHPSHHHSSSLTLHHTYPAAPTTHSPLHHSSLRRIASPRLPASPGVRHHTHSTTLPHCFGRLVRNRDQSTRLTGG